jgi:hypothetical protein
MRQKRATYGRWQKARTTGANAGSFRETKSRSWETTRGLRVAIYFAGGLTPGDSRPTLDLVDVETGQVYYETVSDARALLRLAEFATRRGLVLVEKPDTHNDGLTLSFERGDDVVTD